MKLEAYEARLAYVLAMQVIQSQEYQSADDELRVAVSWGLQLGRDAFVTDRPIACLEPSE